MPHRTMDDFRTEREALNELTLERANLEIKRFFSLDSQTYRDGALPARTKELLGLVASMVLRCDDCVLYHLDRCHAAWGQLHLNRAAVARSRVVPPGDQPGGVQPVQQP